ncbi:hypothetical protein CH68_1860 [Francisella tularensis subsp. holarctica]|uniref:Uncharacterized protein n=1 Tax=Francisella tularensis subsp. holarctica (strain LVS) TaxID=376619 RepID=A0AAI8FU68_FRATH|nr:hypothetical protein DA46_1019 [Francisella tularensis subsp. holarctica]AJI59602.1 hypothetical protein AW21_539 [Francisella tularensis subsp. holarctica LVS]AJI62957.1 hypothetical protein CH65_667 [Francisella tularensis subsp. tularensis]KFJ65831.1 hypothetical protein DR81_689 [Francisella tularensis]AJI65731.1 hypothetical protein CH67_2129 [Francisella tularensis subsp. holarctica]
MHDYITDFKYIIFNISISFTYKRNIAVMLYTKTNHLLDCYESVKNSKT